MDFLSYSPILVDILQYVDYRNIPNCELVNKRINDVIQKNSLNMPREYADLTIRIEEDIHDAGHKGVSVYTNSDCDRIFITKERTFLLKYKPSTLEYYKRNDTPVISTRDDRLPERAMKERLHQLLRAPMRFPGVTLDGGVSFPNKSSEEGLRTLLSLLFRRYYYRNINLFNFPDDWQPILLDEFRRNCSRCHSLYDESMAHDIHQLVKTLGCSVLEIVNQADLKSNILEVTRWNRPITLQHCGEKFLEETVNLLQMLMSGSLTLQKVEVHSSYKMRKQVDHSLNNDAADPTTPIMKKIIEDVKENWDKSKKDWKKVNIKKMINTERCNDNIVISITYSYSCCSWFDIHIKQL